MYIHVDVVYTSCRLETMCQCHGYTLYMYGDGVVMVQSVWEFQRNNVCTEREGALQDDITIQYTLHTHNTHTPYNVQCTFIYICIYTMHMCTCTCTMYTHNTMYMSMHVLVQYVLVHVDTCT